MKPGAVVLVAVLASACSSPNPTVLTLEPLRVEVAELSFDETWVGASLTKRLRVQNPNPVSVSASLSVSGAFGTPQAGLELGGGDDVTLDVSFTPVEAGPARGTLTVGAVVVALLGVGRQPPACPPSEPCRRSRFDFTGGACVREDLPDDSACTSTLACFTSAVCVRGECLGASTSCDDQNRCTLDLCGEQGCTFADSTFDCPTSSNPCEAELCDSRTGCGQQPVPDGTACGARDCSTAMVCIGGQCVSRAAPQTQLCVGVVAGEPRSCGVADGPASVARFAGLGPVAVDVARGALYVVDALALYDDSAVSARIRRVSRAGVVSTLAGGSCDGPCPQPIDGVGSAARFVSPRDLAVDSRGSLYVADRERIRKLSPTGLVTTFVADAGDPRALAIGPDDSVWALTLSNVSNRGEWALTHWTQRGQLLSRHLTTPASGLLLAPDGRRFVTRTGLELVEEVLADGGRGSVLPRTRFTLPDAGFDVAAFPSFTMSPAGELIVNGWGPDGQAIGRFSLSGELRSVAEVEVVDPLGANQTFLEADSQGNVIVAAQCTLAQLRADGGVQLVAGPPQTSLDELPFLREVWPPIDRLVPHPSSGVLAWGAPPGPGWVWLHDGLADPLPDVPRVLAAHAGQLYAVTRLRDGGATVDRLAPDGGRIDARPVPVERGEPALVSTAAGLAFIWKRSEDTHLTLLHADGGSSVIARFQRFRAPRDLAEDGDGFVFSADDGRIWRLGADGGTSPLSGRVQARSIARDVDGTFLFVTEFVGEHLMRLDPGTGRVSTVIELSDAPTDVLVEDGGSMLVTVPGAVLRIRP